MPNEHFVIPPHWEWYILLYFFFAGISGGAFVIGTMRRLWGSPADKAASRLAFIISFPLLLVCPILLTLDLGQPLRFWHMLVDSTAGTPVFKAYSPMSLGAWSGSTSRQRSESLRGVHAVEGTPRDESLPSSSSRSGS